MTDAFRILFADDEETFLYSTADLLRREGYECDCIADAADADSLLEKNVYDLVIADLKMPGNADLELVRRLSDRADPLPVILVTGHPSLTSAVQSVELHVVAYMLKPFEFTDLLAKVQIAKRDAEFRRLIRRELSRLREYRQGLMQIDARLKQQPRTSPLQPLQAFVGVTLRNVADGLASLHLMLKDTEDRTGDALGREWPILLPHEYKDVLRDAVATLEKTKNAFKSKDLGELRKKLEGLLKQAP